MRRFPIYVNAIGAYAIAGLKRFRGLVFYILYSLYNKY